MFVRIRTSTRIFTRVITLIVLDQDQDLTNKSGWVSIMWSIGSWYILAFCIENQEFENYLRWLWWSILLCVIFRPVCFLIQYHSFFLKKKRAPLSDFLCMKPMSCYGEGKKHQKNSISVSVYLAPRLGKFAKLVINQ